MCSRFVVDDLVWDEVERLVGQLDRTGFPNGDVFPSGQILILKKGAGKAGLEAYGARWGYPGYGTGKLLINARTETVREKVTFRSDFAQRRCIIPARGFYEWNAAKEKFYFTGSAPVLYLAGIYSNDPQKECVTVLTARANESVRPVHDRMPLLIPQKEVLRWVEDRDWAEQFLQEEPPELLGRKEDRGYEQLSLFS